MLLLHALLLAAPAQSLAPGFQAAPAPYPSGATIRELSDGSFVTCNGDVVQRWSATGALIGSIGAFAAPGLTGAMVVSPSEAFVLVGQLESGELLRVGLAGSGQTTLGFLPGNTDAVFEDGTRAIVSAQPCDVGPACGVSLFRVDTASGGIAALAAMEGTPGPVAFDKQGGLVYGTRSNSPVLAGESDLLRIGAPALAAAPPPAFQSIGNLVVVEIESVPPAGDWNEYTELPGFTGKSYYRWDGPDLFGSPGSGVLRYEFEVQESANYKMRIHNRHDNPTPDQANDCWVRVDGGTWNKVFSNEGTATVGKWNWHSVIEEASGAKYDANYDLSAGRHVVEISGRSKGYMADRLVFYQVGVSYALNLSNPQSIFAPFNATHATTFAAGLTGPSELILEPKTGALFLAEYVQSLGVNRIRRITSQGGVGTFVEGVPFQKIRNLGFRPEPGAGLFLPYQPPGQGVLTFTRQDPGVVNDRHAVTPLRPSLLVAGPGTITGSGPVALAIVDGPPLGYAVLTYAPSPAILPTEIAVVLPGGPPLFVGLNPVWTTPIPVPLALDAGGDKVVPFFFGLGVPGLVGLQAIVLSPAGAVVASSTVEVL